MDIGHRIKILSAYAGITQAELARRIGTTPQNLSNKIKRNSFTWKDMADIAKATGSVYVEEFVLPDGSKI